MKKICICFVFVALLATGLIRPAPVLADPARTALVLYDYRPEELYGKLGFAYAIMLRNLLGHFQGLDVDMMPVQDYTGGGVNSHDITFYLGSYYDNPLPAVFLQDVVNTGNRVVWFKYNLWKLAWDPQYNFAQRYGFGFWGVRGLNSDPSPENPEPGFFDTVVYKNMSMVKYYIYDAASDSVYADPEMGATAIFDPARAVSLVPIRNAVTGEELPYVLRSGNFWYVADIPFSYIGPRDRYLVICDILHDMLDIQHGEQHRALVRLEDVGALVDRDTIRRLSNYLHSRNIPFSLALMPFYRDPFGLYNGGVPQEIHLADPEAADLRWSIDYALARGGSLVMHGYTHQYDETINPHTGITGDDYEFWNIMENAPVAEDSTAWADGRITSAQAEFQSVGYTWFAWETPHYHASPLAYRVFANRFPVTYQRAVYYTSDHPDLNAIGADRDVAVGQFYPYIIYNDYYGQTIIPENLGNIEYDISEIDPSSNYNYTAEDILTNADYALTVRDGFGSFFFHPFWLEADLGVPGFQDFRRVIQGLTDRGFIWTDPTTLP